MTSASPCLYKADKLFFQWSHCPRRPPFSLTRCSLCVPIIFRWAFYHMYFQRWVSCCAPDRVLRTMAIFLPALIIRRGSWFFLFCLILHANMVWLFSRSDRYLHNCRARPIFASSLHWLAYTLPTHRYDASYFFLVIHDVLIFMWIDFARVSWS